MRIMICFDGSEAARALIPVCQRLAEAMDAEVHLVRVSRHRLSVDGAAWSGSIAVDIEKHRQAEEEDRALRRELEEISQDFLAVTRVAVIPGTQVAEDLIRYARGAGIDLIALGCHDRGPLHGGVGGETTVKITRSKVAPVLLGPMVPMALVDLRAVPSGCPVFSRDGYYLGEMVPATGGCLHVVHGDEDSWLPLADVGDLSLASGLRLSLDVADVPAHRVGAPPEAALR